MGRSSPVTGNIVYVTRARLSLTICFRGVPCSFLDKILRVKERMQKWEAWCLKHPLAVTHQNASSHTPSKPDTPVEGAAVAIKWASMDLTPSPQQHHLETPMDRSNCQIISFPNEHSYQQKEAARTKQFITPEPMCPPRATLRQICAVYENSRQLTHSSNEVAAAKDMCLPFASSKAKSHFH